MGLSFSLDRADSGQYKEHFVGSFLIQWENRITILYHLFRKIDLSKIHLSRIFNNKDLSHFALLLQRPWKCTTSNSHVAMVSPCFFLYALCSPPCFPVFVPTMCYNCSGCINGLPHVHGDRSIPLQWLHSLNGVVLGRHTGADARWDALSVILIARSGCYKW